MNNKRLPPGQILREDFPVLHYGDIPEFNESTWDFFIKGFVKDPLELTFRKFMSLAENEFTTDFHCVTGWSTFDLHCKGILLRTVAEQAGPLQEARFVTIFSEYGYTTNLPLEAALEDNVFFAYECNGKSLTPEHGFPLRLVVPALYAYKSAKWVRGMEFLKEDRPGFWETRGYSNSAEPWKEERFA